MFWVSKRIASSKLFVRVVCGDQSSGELVRHLSSGGKAFKVKGQRVSGRGHHRAKRCCNDRKIAFHAARKECMIGTMGGLGPTIRGSCGREEGGALLQRTWEEGLGD